jgi:hypothetical protein
MRRLGWLLVWFMRVVAPTVFVVVGVANIVAGYVPSLADRMGHAPWPLSVGLIVLGGLGAAHSFWIVRVHQRHRQFMSSRQANAQRS